jgi:hypothetical protein
MVKLSASVLVLAGVVAGCGMGHCIDPSKVTYRLTRPDEVESGTRATLVLEVKNRSDDFMLVERVSGDQVDDAANDSLIGPEYGSLDRSPDGTAWIYNPIAQSETPGVFGSGLIAPGGALQVNVDLVPTEPDGTLTIHYRGLYADEASRWLSFSKNPTAEATQRFEKLPEDEIGELDFNRVILDQELLDNPADCTMEMPYRLNLPK